MRGAVLLEDGKGLQLKDDISVPTLEQGWALIRVTLAGVCGTDLEMLKSYKQGFQGVVGHEFVGVVEDIRGNDGCMIKKGARVVGEINIPCKACHICKGSDPVACRNHCPNRRCLGIWKHNGCFAEFITLPIRNLFLVPENVPDSIAVFTEPVAAACRILEQLQSQLVVPSSLTPLQPMTNQQLNQSTTARIAVVGDGRLGLLIASVLFLSIRKDARIVVIGKHQTKLDLLTSSLGASESDQVQPHLETLLLSSVLLEGDKSESCALENQFDIVVEATASSSGFRLATRLARPLGTIVLKSTCSAVVKDTDLESVCHALELQNQARNDIVVKELVMLGSRCGPFPSALMLLSSAVTTLHPLLAAMVDSVFTLDQIDQAITRASTRGVLKVLLSP